VAVDASAQAEPGWWGRLWRLVRETVIILVGALVFSMLLQHFVAQPFIIPSRSMENTLKIGDRVIAQKLTDVHRGDIVVFKDSGEWLGSEPLVNRSPVGQALEFVGLLPDTSVNYLIKRVIGMPGDTVACCDDTGHLTVNGAALQEDGYLYRKEDGEPVAPSDISFSVVVPAGRLFVMGDHRNASADSRCHLSDSMPGETTGENAFVPLADVAGVGWAIFAPFDRTRMLPRPRTFDTIPAPDRPAPDEAVIEPENIVC